MSNRKRDDVRNPDPRVERSTHALSAALVALIEERDYRDVTVQDVLDRAGVSRATFYAHYRNKDDVLLSSYEGMFDALAGVLERPGPHPRVFPVRELLAHVASQGALADGLRRAGRYDEFVGQATAHAARIIERRLVALGLAPAAMPRALLARMLAGAAIEMLEWWLERPDRATPAELDDGFHALVRGAVARMGA